MFTLMSSEIAKSPGCKTGDHLDVHSDWRIETSMDLVFTSFSVVSGDSQIQRQNNELNESVLSRSRTLEKHNSSAKWITGKCLECGLIMSKL